MPRYFCTYFDHRYLTRGLALYESLRRHCPSFQLWVLAMDPLCCDILNALNLDHIRIIKRHDFEAGDLGLSQARNDRSVIEYYFTCTPSLPLFIFNNHREINQLTYIDADLFFFADPDPLFVEMGSGSVAIIAHRFAAGLRHQEQHGLYNVGWICFSRTTDGIGCLQWWRDRCIEWCYDRVEGTRFAEQKYLNEWPQRFKGVVVLQNKGANLALWNAANYRIGVNSEGIFVDDQPLIFFHFHGLKKINRWLYDAAFGEYGLPPRSIPTRSIFRPYLRALFTQERRLKDLLPANTTRIRGETTRPKVDPPSSGLATLKACLKQTKNIIHGIVERRYLFHIGGKLVIKL